jgi:hypothetical protein
MAIFALAIEERVDAPGRVLTSQAFASIPLD